MTDISASRDLTPSSVTSQLEHSSPPDATSPDDVFTDYAKYLIHRKIHHINPGFDWDKTFSEIEPRLPVGLGAHESRLGPGAHKSGPFVPIGTDPGPVGIIGAGVGGLYAAIILKSLDIPYQILEGSDRSGGRVYTHKFCGKQHEKCSDCQCGYFDVGAMRFPDIPEMNRLFHLFNYLHLTEKLREYKCLDDNTFIFLNGVRHKRGAIPNAEEDPFKFSIEHGGNVDPDFISIGCENLMDQATTVQFDRFRRSINSGTKYLMRFDEYSVRGFLADCHKYPVQVIDWLETSASITGGFDLSLAQAILNRQPFTRPGIDWYRLEGGSQVLTDCMAEGLQVKYGQIVTGIRPRSTKIQVSVAGCTQPYQFQHVITTIAIPALRILDLDDCELGFEQRAAMRQLQVESSVKIGIQFTDAWWTNDLGIKGGFSFTDRSIRLVVYPSDDSTVLIACYTRPRDSLVLQSLIGSGDVADKRLKALVLRDISAVHDVPIEYLESKYKTHFAFDWGHDPFAHGAFTFFGPGQFSSLYDAFTLPFANGRLHIAGEALSIRHAWLSGTLDASWRAVLQILYLSYPEKIPEFVEKWGLCLEWLNSGNDMKGNLLLKYAAARKPELFQQN